MCIDTRQQWTITKRPVRRDARAPCCARSRDRPQHAGPYGLAAIARLRRRSTASSRSHAGPVFDRQVSRRRLLRLRRSQRPPRPRLASRLGVALARIRHRLRGPRRSPSRAASHLLDAAPPHGSDDTMVVSPCSTTSGSSRRGRPTRPAVLHANALASGFARACFRRRLRQNHDQASARVASRHSRHDSVSNCGDPGTRANAPLPARPSPDVGTRQPVDAANRAGHRRHRVRDSGCLTPHHACHERATGCADPDAPDDPRPRAMPSSDAGSRPRTVDLARAGHCRYWLAGSAHPVLRSANDTTVVSLRSTISGSSCLGRPISLDARRASALAASRQHDPAASFADAAVRAPTRPGLRTRASSSVTLPEVTETVGRGASLEHLCAV